MPARIRSVSSLGVVGGVLNVDRPAQVAEGDVLFAIQSADVAPGGLSAPIGWASIGRVSGNLIQARVWSRTAGSDEPDSYRFRQPSSAYGTVVVLAVSGMDPAVSPRVTMLPERNPGGGITTPSIQPTAATHLEVRVASGWADEQAVSWTPPSGYGVRATVDAQFGIQTIVAAKTVNSSSISGQKQFLLVPDAFNEAIGISLSIPALADPVIPPGDPFTPGRSQSRYRYRLKSWAGIYLDDLEFAGVTFDKRIGEAGSFSATIPIPNRKVAERVARVIPRDVSELGIGPGVITVEIYRDGVPWGEYWITGAQLGRSRRGTPGISLRGSTMDAYLGSVEMQEALSYTGEDQIDIARALLEHMQAGQTRAGINLILQAGTSGVSRDRAYAADEASYGQRLQELAAVDNGFEWTVNIVPGPAGLERHWVWGYPRLGSSQVTHVFGEGPYGGDIIEWSEEIDALRGATMWRARGDAPPSDDASAESTPLISSTHEATAHLAAGWPRIDRTLTYSGVTQQQTLEDYAAYWAATAPGALRVDAVTVALSSSPSFTPNNLGDMARIWLDNEWHLPHSRVRRIIGVSITPTSRDNGIEEAQLIFEGLEVEGGG